jgi:hypothetical protein
MTCSYSVGGREAIEAPARHNNEVSWGGWLGWRQQHMTTSVTSTPTHNLPSFISIRSGWQLHQRLDVSLLALLMSLTTNLLQISSNRIDLTKSWVGPLCPIEQSIPIGAGWGRMGCPPRRSGWRRGCLTDIGSWSSLTRPRRGRWQWTCKSNSPTCRERPQTRRNRARGVRVRTTTEKGKIVVSFAKGAQGSSGKLDLLRGEGFMEIFGGDLGVEGGGWGVTITITFVWRYPLGSHSHPAFVFHVDGIATCL